VEVTLSVDFCGTFEVNIFYCFNSHYFSLFNKYWAILVQWAMMWVVEVFAVDADFRLGAVFVVRGMNFRAVRAGFVVIAGFGGVIKFLAVSAFA